MENLIRIKWKNKVSFATKENNKIYLLDGDNLDSLKLTDQIVMENEVRILAPVIPRKVIAVGLNYIDHARELKMEVPEEPILFMKPATSVIGPDEEIIYPQMSQQVDYEAELVIVIGRETYKINANQERDYIFGYTCGNDVTARDLQKIDGQWTRSKSFNTFCPLGPIVKTDIDTDNLEISLFLNGEKKQSSNTSNMIFSIDYLVYFVSQIMTLYPGDVIMTGTPPGVGSMRPEDEVEVVIQDIGRLKNKVTSML